MLSPVAAGRQWAEAKLFYSWSLSSRQTFQKRQREPVMMHWMRTIKQSNQFWIALLCLIGEGNGIPLQSSCLENPIDGGAWWAAVHGVAKSRTRLSNFTFTFHFPALEKEMATHSSVLAWRIPGTGEPGGLPSVGSHRVGHDWSDLAAAAAALCLILNIRESVLSFKGGKWETWWLC